MLIWNAHIFQKQYIFILPARLSVRTFILLEAKQLDAKRKMRENGLQGKLWTRCWYERFCFIPVEVIKKTYETVSIVLH